MAESSNSRSGKGPKFKNDSSLTRAFYEGWTDPEIIQSYNDMVNAISQCKIVGKRCPFTDCTDNDKGKSGSPTDAR